MFVTFFLGTKNSDSFTPKKRRNTATSDLIPHGESRRRSLESGVSDF